MIRRALLMFIVLATIVPRALEAQSPAWLSCSQDYDVPYACRSFEHPQSTNRAPQQLMITLAYYPTEKEADASMLEAVRWLRASDKPVDTIDSMPSGVPHAYFRDSRFPQQNNARSVFMATSGNVGISIIGVGKDMLTPEQAVELFQLIHEHVLSSPGALMKAVPAASDLPIDGMELREEFDSGQTPGATPATSSLPWLPWLSR